MKAKTFVARVALSATCVKPLKPNLAYFSTFLYIHLNLIQHVMLNN
jgi:hypothetical protein